MLNGLYILRGHQVVRLDDEMPRSAAVLEWGRFFNDTDSRRVAETKIEGIRVSTVFLGIDHNFNSHGPPLLFETMVFGGEHDEMTDRYTTWTQAIKGHQQMCGFVYMGIARQHKWLFIEEKKKWR